MDAERLRDFALIFRVPLLFATNLVIATPAQGGDGDSSYGQRRKAKRLLEICSQAPGVSSNLSAST